MTERTDHDVVVVGSINLDLVATARRLPGPGETVLGDRYAEHPGGKGLNQAVAAARAGARVALVAAVGLDAAGDRLLAVADEDGIDTSWVVRSPAGSGRAVITVGGAGENSIVVVPGANRECPSDRLPGGRVLLAQLEVPVVAVERALVSARRSGSTTILNPAPADADIAALLALCDVVVPNEHELELLGGEGRLLDRGVETLVVTRGAAGVEVVTRSDRWTVDPFPVTALDTTAAGDAFCGVLAARLAHGDTMRSGVRWAAAAGALATTVHGAVPSLPHRHDIELLLGTR